MMSRGENSTSSISALPEAGDNASRADERAQELLFSRALNSTTGSNWIPYVYAELITAISAMTKMPKGSEFHLDEHVGQKALDVISFISEHLDTAPPRLMNQEGEAAVFTWDLGRIKRYLTVAEDDSDVMLLLKQNRMICEESVERDDGAIDYERLIQNLSSGLKSKTSQD